MKRIITILLVGALVLVGLPSSQAATSHELTITAESAGPSEPFKKFDTSLDAFDFNGDGRKEIVAHNENRDVYVFDSSDGSILAEFETRYPAGWGARPINPPEVAIMEHGGAPHVIIANSAAIISLHRYEGEVLGESVFTKVWDRRLSECHTSPGMDSQAVVYDLDGDGDLEILAQTEEVGVFALRMDGSTMWKRCIAGGNSGPAVADMDFDGVPDVVFTSDGGVVTRVSGLDGRTIWTFWAGASEYDLGSGAMPVGAAIGQIDGRGSLDVAVGVRDSSDREDPHTNRAALFALNGDHGKPLWFRQHPDATPLTYTHPIIYDVDGDGEADILWADWNTVGHKPPVDGDDVDKWALSGTPAVYRHDATGDLHYRTEIGSYWSNKDLALADVDGDGVQEIIADDGASMVYIDSRSGTIETSIGLQGWVPTRGPVVFDMHGDGSMQWILPVHKGSGNGAIMMFDTHVGYNAAWPHVPSATATEGPPPPSGEFSADFHVPDTTNNWWVEVSVDANAPISGVTADVDGTPRALEKQSWGAWAKSFHVADGSQVVFKARDSDNREATSKTYTWGDPEAEPPGGFAATFDVPDTSNNWWVEADVDANAPITGVTAEVDGTPRALEKQDWGAWAKSFHVADGSQVQFTATSSGGDTATSDPYTWGDADPEPPGDFSASFNVPDTSNNWWVEAYVDADQALSGVTATVDGGTPRALDRTDWDSWAKSFHVPDGSQVQFTATSSGGDQATSDPYTWGDAGAEPPSEFSATFTVPDTSNNWWVEAYVDADQALSGVTATVDGGTPRALDRTDWDSWAKSFHVPDGSQVQFTATSSGGDQATSDAYTWG